MLLHTWVCQLWRWPCALEAERRTPEGAGAGSKRKRGIQSQHAPVGNLTACTALSPAEWDHKQSHAQALVCFTGSCFHQHATSVPEPGRKFLTVMVLPGAGKGASIIPLIKGCTRAGEMALLFSTSSRILKWQNTDGCLTVVDGTGWLGVHFDTVRFFLKQSLVNLDDIKLLPIIAPLGSKWTFVLYLRWHEHSHPYKLSYSSSICRLHIHLGAHAGEDITVTLRWSKALPPAEPHQLQLCNGARTEGFCGEQNRCRVGGALWVWGGAVLLNEGGDPGMWSNVLPVVEFKQALCELYLPLRRARSSPGGWQCSRPRGASGLCRWAANSKKNPKCHETAHPTTIIGLDQWSRAKPFGQMLWNCSQGKSKCVPSCQSQEMSNKSLRGSAHL